MTARRRRYRSLDNSGIVAPFDADGLYWVTWLVPLSMRRAA